MKQWSNPRKTLYEKDKKNFLNGENQLESFWNYNNVNMKN